MKTRYVLLTFVVIAVAAAGLFAVAGEKGSEPAAPAATTALSETAPAAGTATAAAPVDTEKALAERSLGDPSAPVRIEEFASLNCSHCAHFSKETFDKLKEAYIDTGKVYFVFTDFPLNAAAMDAAAVARCLPEERYFQFVKFLFETYDKWSLGDHTSKLRQNAKLVGMSDGTFDSCLADQKLREGLAAKMQASADKYKLDSTPSFVVNDGAAVLRGALPLAEFDKTLAPLLAKDAQVQ